MNRNKNKITLNNSGSYPIEEEGFRRSSALKLGVVDWLCDVPNNQLVTDIVEVQFKNTRKGYFRNVGKLNLKKGDWVAVEASPGHDIGEVTLTGYLVEKQMVKNRIDPNRYVIRDIYRLASPTDMSKRSEAKAKEQETMIQARQIAKSLGLQMKIGDVEYQGDGTKAIFYYIADERVDFRQLIKVFAETFRVRIEMKQIGARQEAGRIGGTGPCGRELCCATWMSNFNSVGTNAARLQNISLNPQKLAGQCAKLKCCLNFETCTYKDALRQIPDRSITLETQEGTYYYFNADPLKGEVTYSTAPNMPANLKTLTAQAAQEIVEMNKRGEKPATLGGKETNVEATDTMPHYENVVGQDDVTRFDKKLNERRGRGRNTNNRNRNNERNSERSSERNDERSNRNNNQRRPNNRNNSPRTPRNTNTPNNSKRQDNEKA